MKKTNIGITRMQTHQTTNFRISGFQADEDRVIINQKQINAFRLSIDIPTAGPMVEVEKGPAFRQLAPGTWLSPPLLLSLLLLLLLLSFLCTYRKFTNNFVCAFLLMGAQRATICRERTVISPSSDWMDVNWWTCCSPRPSIVYARVDRSGCRYLVSF